MRIFGFGRRESTPRDIGSNEQNPEDFVAPPTGEQRNIKDRSRWERILSVAGLSLTTLGSAEAGKLQGKEMLGAEIAIHATAMGKVLQLLPENRTVTEQDGVTKIDVKGDLNQNMAINDFTAKMDKNREHKKAVDSFTAAVKEIKDEIEDPQIEKELIIRMGRECEEGTLVVTGENSKTSVGEVNTVGDLVNFFAEHGKITCRKAYEDNGDIKRSGKLTGTVMHAVSSWVEESDPTKSAIEEVEKVVDLY